MVFPSAKYLYISFSLKLSSFVTLHYAMWILLSPCPIQWTIFFDKILITLNQILYTVEAGSIFKGLDLTERVTDELGTEIRDIIVHREQVHPQEKEIQKGKMVVWGGLANSWEKEKLKAKEKRKDISIWMQSPKRIARRDKKVFFSDQCKEIEENNRIGKTRDLVKKIRDNQGNFSCKDGHNKGQKWYGPNRSRRCY